MKIKQRTLFTRFTLMGFSCALSVSAFSAIAQEEVKEGLSTLKKAAIFASRNTNPADEKQSAETQSESASGEVVIKKAGQPWLTNGPYLNDEYSQQYAAAKELHYKQKDKVAAECLEQHKDSDNQDFWEVKCKMIAVSKQTRFKMPSRGSVGYVKEHYLPMQKLPKQKFGIALKGTLEELAELRTKTRSVSGLSQDEINPGELSYEDVNAEICLIEEMIGRIIRKDYCHS